LAQHPAIEAKLFEEIDTVLMGRKPQADDIKNLPYTGMIIKEAMRLYPPVWVLARRSNEVSFIGDYTIPGGTTIIIPIYALHRNPNYWESPEVFDPERFAPKVAKGRANYAYMPFGGGPRRCIGQHFAMLEAQLVLVTIAQQYKLELVANQSVIPYHSITLRPKNGIKMIIAGRAKKFNSNHTRLLA